MDDISERIQIFNRIRDIPYGIIPELTNPKRCQEIISLNKGFCYPKHFLLCRELSRMGLSVLIQAYEFEWKEFSSFFPSHLRQMAYKMPPEFHLNCLVDTGDGFVTVDATLDPALKKLGFKVNSWDGLSSTDVLATPTSTPLIFHPNEIVEEESYKYPSRASNLQLAFYQSLNEWFEKTR